VTVSIFIDAVSLCYSKSPLLHSVENSVPGYGIHARRLGASGYAAD